MKRFWQWLRGRWSGAKGGRRTRAKPLTKHSPRSDSEVLNWNPHAVLILNPEQSERLCRLALRRRAGRRS
jgi:hypothetical protein